MSRYCLCYSYMETPNSKKNIEFFLKNGVCKNSDIFYIFIIVGNTYSVQFQSNQILKLYLEKI